MVNEPTLEEKIQLTANPKVNPISVVNIINVLFEEFYLSRARSIEFYRNPDETTKAVVYGEDYKKEVSLPITPTSARTRCIIMAGLDLSRHKEPQIGEIEYSEFLGYHPENEREEINSVKCTVQTFSLAKDELGVITTVSLNYLALSERTVPKVERERIMACHKIVWDKITEAFKDIEAGRKPLDWLDQNNEISWDKLLPPEESFMMRIYASRPFLLKEVLYQKEEHKESVFV